MPIPILKTKLRRTSLAPDLLRREALLKRLDAGRNLPLTLVSAPAGYGKSTLISQWLEEREHPAAWISLDEDDNDLRAFISYLLAGVRTLFPKAGSETQIRLKADILPPPSVLANYLTQDMEAIKQPFILALDDYFRIRDTDVHELMGKIIKHPPVSVQIVIITRYNPPLPIASLRAGKQVVEIKTDSLAFSLTEVSAYLNQVPGHVVGHPAVEKIHRHTEGWPAGLHLATLAMEPHSDINELIKNIEHKGHHIEDYLIEEILTHQQADLSDWLMKTAILDRFNASLCGALCGAGDSRATDQMDGANFLETLQSKGLFCVSLDDSHLWYRYHHLFQEILQRQLNKLLSTDDISHLHRRAAEWFEAHGLIEEALYHTISADGSQASGQMIIRNRHIITQKERWYRLDRWLSNLLPSDVDNNPELLIIKAWSFRARGRLSEMIGIIDRAESLVNNLIPDDYQERLSGEIDVLRSVQHVMASNVQATLKLSTRALDRLPSEFASERIAAIILKAVSLKMTGDLNTAQQTIYDALEKEACYDGGGKGRLLMSLCFIYWIDADLEALNQTAKAMLKIGTENNLLETKSYAHYFLGAYHYQINQLADAQEQLVQVVVDDSISGMAPYIRSLQVLSMTYQAQGNAHKASKLITNVTEKLLKNTNTYYLPAMRAFQAELALRQGRLAEAVRWEKNFDVGIPREAYGYSLPELTAVKIKLSQATPSALQQADDLLNKLLPFFESTHNTRYVIESLSLKALVHAAMGDEPNVLSFLGKAIQLGQSSGFIRLFVDLGPELFGWIHRLRLDGEGLFYAGRIMAEFKKEGQGEGHDSPQPENSVSGLPSNQPLPTPLTSREIEIVALLARHLSNKEIAEKLFISLGTVKSHIIHIYRKLDVSNRKEAVAKAAGLNLLTFDPDK